MQYPRNKYACIRSFAVCLLGITASRVSAQTALSHVSATSRETSAPKLLQVHLWVAGRILPLRVSPVTDTRETFVPLTALEAVGADFRLTSKGDAVHVVARSKRQADVPLVQLKGIAMIPLSALAKVLDATIETSATESTAKATFSRSDTIYLLARVTDARFENGALHVRTSFPVPTHTRMLAETNPPRGYVDCVGASVSDGFRTPPLDDREKLAIRVRTGQNSPTVARIVVELADGAALSTGDTATASVDLTINVFGRPRSRAVDVTAATGAGTSAPTANIGTNSGANVGARVGKSANSDRGPRGDVISNVPPVPMPIDQGERGVARSDPGNATVPGVSGTTPNPSVSGAETVLPVPKVPKGSSQLPAQPIEVRSLNVGFDNPTLVRFDVVTSAKARPIVRFTPGTTQMLVDIPNAVLALPESEEPERLVKHPLIGSVKIETIQAVGPPTTRITLDTARILGYSIDVKPGAFALELRVPRNATGALCDKLIVVDAGHGGAATGATSSGICEKDCTLGIAMKLRAELEACGARVVMTRTRDCDVSLPDRSRMGNEIGADLFISIHNDSNERSNSASGTSTYYHNSEPSSRALATCVQQAVMATTGLPSRGVLSDTVMYNSGFAVLRGSSMPAVLCEVAYINNQTDRRKLIDAQFQQRVAKAICDGLRSYVEGTPLRTSPAFARPVRDQAPTPSTLGESSSQSGS